MPSSDYFPLKWLIAILIEGFVTIAIEVCVLRQLLPVVGNSVIVTSLVIGTVLLFMALGYYHGGRPCADPLKKLRYNFLVASIISGVGLSSIFVTYLFFGLLGPLHVSFYPSLCIYLLLTIAPAIYCLSQTAPTIMNNLSQRLSAGRIGGTVLALSTVGSFASTIVVTLILLNFAGVGISLFVVSCLPLALFVVFQSKVTAADFLITGTIVFFLITCFYFLNIRVAAAVYLRQDIYADYSMSDNGITRTFHINNSLSSQLTKDNKAFPYIEEFKKILFVDMAFRHKKILVLGAGGFTLTAQGNYQNDVTYVDIDKNLPSVVQPNFNKKINGHFVASDARYYLNTHPEKYDAIVSDAYSNVMSLPPQTITYEYFHTIQQHLTKKGVALLNIIANPLLNDPFSTRINRTILYAFNNRCMVMPLQINQPVSNIIYLCTPKPGFDKKKFYSDNQQTAAFDFWRILNRSLGW